MDCLNFKFKKMKKLNVFFAVAILLYVTACSNDELVDNIPNKNQKEIINNVDNISGLETVAKLIASIDIDKDIMGEVKTGVDRSLQYGLDEEFRFTDMIKPLSSKLRRSPVTSSLIEKMSEKLNYTRNTGIDSELFFTYLSNNDVQIYWAYSKNWDGKTVPVITFAPEDEDATWNYGYKQSIQSDGSIRIDTIIVDEEYLSENSGWIINRNELAYSDLPNFENGEFEKNGVIFDQPSVETKGFGINGWFPDTDPNMVYSFYINPMRVTKQLDGVFAGGSEMVISCAHPEMAGGVKAPVTVLRKSFTREEISKATTKSFSTPLNTNWRQEQINNALKIIEEDQGEKTQWDFSLGLKVDGKDIFSIAASIPFQNEDDEIVQVILDRDFINSQSNRGIGLINPPGELSGWRTYVENGVSYNLPIIAR